jgi:hypothetical protein
MTYYLPHLEDNFYVKIQLFVTAKSDREPDRVLTDPHWFGSLDPDLDPH